MRETREEAVRASIVRWVLFTLCISFLPLVFDFGCFVIRNRTLDWRALTATLGAGQLLLITCSLAASGMGELIGLRLRKSAPIVAGWGCFVTACSSAFVYAFVHDERTDPTVVTLVSIVLCILGIVASTACVIVSFRKGLRG